MKNIILTLFCILTSFVLIGQNLRNISTFPAYLNENSGIITQGKNSAWIHNDSGDGPIIYKIDSNGTLLDSLTLSGVTAIDFEDITQDIFGNVYIGDIGNNNHNRTNLVVYKIPNPSTIIGNTVIPEAINFSYSDQTQFPDPNQNSDCEALFHHNNHLFLISKNWGSSGFSKLYQLPDSGGNHIAQLIDSFVSPMVTAADFHSSGKLAVLSMDRVTIFDQFTGIDFFGGRTSTFYFSLTQKEGVSFVNSNSLYITQEHHRFFPGAKLYELEFSPYLSLDKKDINFEFNLSPNPASDFISLNYPKESLHPLTYSIYNTEGKLQHSGIISSDLERKIEVSQLKTGLYFLTIKSKNQVATQRFIKQ
ncbi:MAG: T9SS type A sorting domain-containing protein [Flavobacteriales bacterium]